MCDKHQRIPKAQSKKDDPEKLATQGTQDEEKQSKTQHNMCWTPPHANKYKQRKQDMIPIQTTGRKDEPNIV